MHFIASYQLIYLHPQRHKFEIDHWRLSQLFWKTKWGKSRSTKTIHWSINIVSIRLLNWHQSSYYYAQSFRSTMREKFTPSPPSTPWRHVRNSPLGTPCAHIKMLAKCLFRKWNPSSVNVFEQFWNGKRSFKEFEQRKGRALSEFCKSLAKAVAKLIQKILLTADYAAPGHRRLLLPLLGVTSAVPAAASVRFRVAADCWCLCYCFIRPFIDSK